MSDFDRRASVPTDDALEKLLKHAAPRPTPSKTDETAIRQAVRAEWQNVSGKHRSRRRVLNFAIAATVLIGVFSVFSTFRTPVIETVQVASIEKSFGSIYLLGKQSVLNKTNYLAVVQSGQTIETGSEAGLALAWGNGGSMRMDENTRVEFTTNESVYLRAGRIYFDSRPSTLTAGTSASDPRGFVVRTDFGEIEHIGTQFMARVEPEVLTVSVREGRVSIDRANQGPVVASSGKQVKLSGRKLTELSLAGWGESWEWVHRTSPPANLDEKPIDEFLRWVCRETGLTLDYQGQAERVARIESLNGTIDSEPLQALTSWMETTTLTHRVDFDEGVIYVYDDQ